MNVSDYIFTVINKPSEPVFVGNKAFNLFKVTEKVLVPEFICLRSDLMFEVLKLPENKKASERIHSLWINKLSLFSYIDEIHELICNLSFPEKMLEEIIESLKSFNVGDCFSVRSSSVYEDSLNKSAPGIFETYLNVTIEDLENKIKMCWASNFSAKSTFYFGSKFDDFERILMGVIIQKMTPGKTAGIMFSRNPVNNANQIVIEEVTNCSNDLTDGEKTGNRIILDPVEKKVLSGKECENSFIDQMIENCRILEKLFKVPVDIEWVYKESKIHIIQIRPISTYLNNVEKREFKSVSISELDGLNEIGTGLELKVSSWKGKKQHFNRACDSLKIPHLKWVFLKNYSPLNCSQVKEMLSDYKGDYVSVAVNKTLIDVVLKKEDLIGFLNHYSEIEEDGIISIRDLPVNQVSLISNVVDKDFVRIEVIDGIMRGLKTGELQTSVLILNKDGVIVDAKEVHNPEMFTISFPSGEIYLTKNENKSFASILPIIKQISFWTFELNRIGQKGAVEWWICNDELFATDISKSAEEVSSIARLHDMDCISKGKIEGNIVKVEDATVKKLEKFVYSTAISVDSFDESILKDEDCSELLGKIRELSKTEKVILCVKRPYLSLAFLLDYVDGVLLEEASLLCHMSVILREKNIPAYALGEKYKELQNGNYISF